MKIDSKNQLLKLENMFYKNVLIKETMLNLEPKEEFFSSPEMVTKYSNLFLAYLDTVKKTFISMLNDFSVDGYSLEDLEQLFLKIEEDILRNYNNSDQIKAMFNKYIASMRPNFIESVNKNYVGYSYNRGEDLIKPTTLNELLHLHHFATLNNENVFESMPLLKKVNNPTSKNLYKETWQGVEYYGEETSIANEIFETIFNVMYNSPKYGGLSSVAHIVSLKNKVLVMLRDLGHATTIEINFNDKEVELIYFIPKICNIEMIKNLQGILYIGENVISGVAKGSFVVERQRFKERFTTLLYGIPMDDDMQLEEKKQL